VDGDRGDSEALGEHGPDRLISGRLLDRDSRPTVGLRLGVLPAGSEGADQVKRDTISD
jgi:hypothetical protein